jgi:hypothetical protein
MQTGFDAEAYNLHLAHVWNSNRTSAFTMPWDKTMPTPWQACKRLRTVYPDMVKTAMPPMPVRQEQEAQLDFYTGDSSFKVAGLRAASSIDNRLWAEKLSWERKAAYKKWSAIILHEVGAWEIARLQVQCKTMEFARGGLLESIADSLGAKSTSTLHSRAGPLLQYINFFKERGKPCIPLHEFQVYDYLKACDHRAASFPRSLLLSINFADHHFGFHGADSIRASGRIKGLVDIIYAQRKKLVQRPPLTVKQIKHLEAIVHDEGRAVFDRLASGYFLFLVYGRLRYSDGLQVTSMLLDQRPDGYGFLECLAEKTKTSVTLEKKTRHIPIAVPLLSLGDLPWVQTWMKLREDKVIPIFGDGSGPVPLLTTPAMGGGWSRVPLTVTAAAGWLRALLQGVEPEGPVKVGTHSCKASLLSMCAKFNMSGHSRRILGYHSGGTKESSMLVYSRDSAAGPLRDLSQMLKVIKEGKFLPDETRSGRFVDMDPTQPADDNDDGDSSSTDTDDEENGDCEIEEEACKNVVGEWKPEKEIDTEGTVYVRNKLSRCIHVIADEAGAEFKCGRRMSTSYETLESKPAFFSPACNMCFKAA